MRLISAIFFVCIGIFLAQNYPEVADKIWEQAMTVLDAVMGMIEGFQS